MVSFVNSYLYKIAVEQREKDDSDKVTHIHTGIELNKPKSNIWTLVYLVVTNDTNHDILKISMNDQTWEEYQENEKSDSDDTEKSNKSIANQEESDNKTYEM